MIGLLILAGEVVRGAGQKLRLGEGAESPGRTGSCRRGPSRTGISSAPQSQVNRTRVAVPWQCETTSRLAQSLNH